MQALHEFCTHPPPGSAFPVATTAALVGRRLHTPRGLHKNELVVCFDRFDPLGATTPRAGSHDVASIRQRREFQLRVSAAPWSCPLEEVAWHPPISTHMIWCVGRPDVLSCELISWSVRCWRGAVLE